MLTGIVLAVALFWISADGKAQGRSEFISTDYTTTSQCAAMAPVNQHLLNLRLALEADDNVATYTMHTACINLDKLRTKYLKTKYI